MAQTIHCISLVVRDYDEAIDFYIRRLGFQLVEDTPVGDFKRWVVIKPPGPQGPGILLARASSEEQHRRVGNQTGGKVLLVVHTDDLDADVDRLRNNGVSIVRGPVKEAWGKVVVFADLYGNLWDLVQPDR